MNIPHTEWEQASGSYAIGPCGELFQIIGFIDRPAVIMRPVNGSGPQVVQIMGSETSKEYRRLVEESA